MGDTSDTPEPQTQRHVQEYEDPHYHDDDEVPAPEDGRPQKPRPTTRPKLPPRPRRYEED
jgi:hypothetical protein